MVHRLCLDEEWWSKIDFLIKFTSPAFELLRNAAMDQPFLGEVYDAMDTMVEKTMEIISQESPQLLFVDDHFADLVKKIIVDRWNNFNASLHTLAHALNPKFFDEELIVQSNGKRKEPHKDREVANGVKKALMRMFPTHLHREKAKDLVYVHSNLRLASCRGPKYSSGHSKEWDVDIESLDLELSLIALNIEDWEPRSGIGQSSSSTPPSTIEHASASIFDEDYDDED
eukprot:PITA_24769